MHKHSLLASVLRLAAFVLPSTIFAQDSPSWQQYVRAPSSRIVRPKTILSDHTQGNITNPDGMITGEATTIFSQTADSTENTTLIVDFGQNVVGQVVIDFAGSTNGSSQGYPGMTLAFSEALEFLTDRSDYTRSDRASGSQQIITSGTDHIAVLNDPFTWIDEWGCQFNTYVCRDGLHAFRYVKISFHGDTSDFPYVSSDGEISISSVGLQWVGYLGTADTYSGWFECSDTNLTQWWYDGTYTVEMGTAVFNSNDTEPRNAASETLLGKVVLQDGAKRDRDPYTGDLAVASLTSYLSHNDSHDATLNILEDLARHQRSDGWLPPASIVDYTLTLFDYPLWWVSVSYDYVFYTGNTSYISDYYPVLLNVLDNYYPANTDNTTNLLLRPSGYGDFAFLPRDGEAGYYSALYVLSLKRAAELATLISKGADAQRWTDRAATVSTSFQNTLWDSSVSAYFDRNCSDSGCDAHAQDGNSLAILAGIANETTATSALSYLAANNAHFWGNSFYDAAGDALGDGFSTRVYAFISYFEAAARFETGDAEGALDMIRRTWGWMASQDPGITHWEGIADQGSKYEGADTSLSHGWSTGVTPLLTQYVLGVKPMAPGFSQFVVKPVVTDDITWARGVVPTPYGGISVSWERDDSGQIVVDVDAPSGTNFTVATDMSAGRSLEVDGMETRGVINGRFVEVALHGGRRSVVRSVSKK
ncbi:glycoside hydrolase family 78 protein [Xylariaceae sp. FL1272]|nr:glycoside hydrolase family 78 protein [Xylariaceae sp. FL1272]